MKNASVRAPPVDISGSKSPPDRSHVSVAANTLTTMALARSLLFARSRTTGSSNLSRHASAIRSRVLSRRSARVNCTTANHKATLRMVVKTVASSNESGEKRSQVGGSSRAAEYPPV